MRPDDFFAADLARQEAIYPSIFPRHTAPTKEEPVKVHHCACGAMSPTSRGIGIHIGHHKDEPGRHYRVGGAS